MVTTPYISSNELPPDTSFIYKISFAEILYVFVLGGLVGLFTPIISDLLVATAVKPLFCHGQQFAICAQGGSIGFSLAIIITSLLALVVLVNKQAYQPLMNVTAPFAALWGAQQFLLPLSEGNNTAYYVVSTLLFALCYALFYVLLRIKHFWIAFTSILVVIVAIRLQL